MSFLTFPELRPQTIVVTPKLVETQRRVFAVHQLRGQMVVLSGASGAGKTMAADYLTQRINESADALAPNAFYARYYVATDMRAAADDVLQRRLLAEFAKLVLRHTVPKDLRTICVPGLMSTIATGLRLANIQMVFVDEAGHIPTDGLDHLATLINTVATAQQHPLTLVLVGMHDLPTNVLALPQVDRRVTEVVWFEPYDVPTALRVLRTVHPYFETLNPATPEGQEVMEFLMDDTVSGGGLVGRMVPLVEKAVGIQSELELPFGIRVLRAAHARTDGERTAGQKAMRRGYAKGGASK